MIHISQFLQFEKENIALIFFLTYVQSRHIIHDVHMMFGLMPNYHFQLNHGDNMVHSMK